MNHFDFLELHFFRMAPQHCQDQIVNRRDRLVNVPEVHVQEVLLSKRRRWSDFQGLQEILVRQNAGLEHEHPGVEVERRRWAHLGVPLDSVRALLAVTDLVLRRVAPSFLAETVHHGVELAVRQVEEVVDVVVHLNVSVQVYHLVVFHKLQNDKGNLVKQKSSRTIYGHV